MWKKEEQEMNKAPADKEALCGFDRWRKGTLSASFQLGKRLPKRLWHGEVVTNREGKKKRVGFQWPNLFCLAPLLVINQTLARWDFGDTKNLPDGDDANPEAGHYRVSI